MSRNRGGIEVIPLPRERIREKRPVNLDVRDLDSWPGQDFQILFDWNGVYQKWIVEMRNKNTDTTFARSPADLLVPYTYADRLTFVFYDRSRNAREVNAQNLARNVKLGVFSHANLNEELDQIDGI